MDSTVIRGRNQFEHIVIIVLRDTSSGWDSCLSAIAERRRTWRWPSVRLKLDGLTRIPRQIVRVTGRIRVRQTIERDNINPAAFFLEPVAPSRSRSRRKCVYNMGTSKAARVLRQSCTPASINAVLISKRTETCTGRHNQRSAAEQATID